MKKSAAIVIASCCALVIVSCTSQEDKDQDPRALVLTTFTVIADMAKNVSGDLLNIKSITQPGAEIHNFHPSPQDIRHARQAALILDNGFDLERWFEKFVRQSKAEHVTLTEGIDPIYIASGRYGGLPNPHAWMSPRAALTYVDNIIQAFRELDPTHERQYVDNGEEYKNKLREIEKTLATNLAGLPQGNRTLVTCEGAFSYLTRDFKLKEVFLWPVNADNQGTPAQIRDAIDTVTRLQVPAVFCESTVNDSAMKQVASETGARMGGKLFVDSLSPEGGPAPTYLDLLRYDSTLVIEGLTGKKVSQ